VYVKRRKGNRESIPAMKDQHSKLVTDAIGKNNSIKSYYASLCICEQNNPQIQSTESGKPFTLSINIIRNILTTIGKRNPSYEMAFLGKF